MSSNVVTLRLPEAPLPLPPANWLQIVIRRLRGALCDLVNWLGLPGVIKDLTFTDMLTGQQLEIRVGWLFTRISIDGRDYYFDRLSGRFDGTGSGCS